MQTNSPKQNNTSNQESRDTIFRVGACLLFSTVAVRILPRKGLALLGAYGLYELTKNKPWPRLGN